MNHEFTIYSRLLLFCINQRDI